MSISCSRDWRKNRSIGKTAVKGVIYNQEKRIRDLKISSGIDGEAVNGGAVLGGGDCSSKFVLNFQKIKHVSTIKNVLQSLTSF